MCLFGSASMGVDGMGVFMCVWVCESGEDTPGDPKTVLNVDRTQSSRLLDRYDHYHNRSEP